MTGQELVTVESHAPITVFGTDDPAAIMARVVEIAKPLGDFIKQQKMSMTIGSNEYVKAEGWSFMGAMLGISPNVTRVDVLRTPEGGFIGFEAHVELRTRDGSVVGSAIAECTVDERNWGDRDSFALKSMAQTRATGKAYRMALGFVMAAAGYEATPAEEMPDPRPQGRVAPPRARQAVDVPARDVSEPASPLARPETFKNIGEFLTWAMRAYQLGRGDVCRVLDIADVKDIKDFGIAADAIETWAAPSDIPF